MKTFRLLAGAFLALGASGCLASKGDIQMLQGELRASRLQSARADSISMARIDSLSRALALLMQAQMSGDANLSQALAQNDTRVSALTTRVTNSEITTRENLKSMSDQISQSEELARQSLKGVNQNRADVEKVLANPPASVTDTSKGVSVTAGPGSATLLREGKGNSNNNSCRAARRSFDQLLTQYPASIEAPEAQYLIAESFVQCPESGISVSLDSVYKLVTDKYPKSDFSAVAIYKRAELLSKAGKRDAALPLYQRIVCEYPKSTVVDQAKDRLGSPTSCR